MLNEFKKFILKGNVVDLSTGVIIGAAFTGIVAAFTKGIVEPILKLAGAGASGKTGLLSWQIKEGVILDADIIVAALFQFLVTAAVIFFVIVKPANKLIAMMKKEEAEAPPAAPAADIQLLTEIRDLLKK